MTGKKLREKYLRFFEKKGHTIIPSASLIPENDPTVLFITAGMHPLVPYLLGQKHPEGTRITNVQKCIRTSDIEEVGDDWHLTFFEMMGNWSLGDYWKPEAIEYSFELLTKEFKIPLKKIAITCFEGDKANNIARDTESAEIWASHGIPEERIKFLGRSENWWGPAGETGPCGPDVEMFYWASDEQPPKKFDTDDKRWVEIGNDVFMQYNKTIDGKYEELEQKNVDNGRGLERTVAILNGHDNIFGTDLFQPIIKKIKSLATEENIKSERIIADHLRTATFILGDPKGVAPSNLDQGYILRRLIRRAVRRGKMIGINKPFTFEIAEVIIKEYKDVFPELQINKDFIIEQLVQEEEKFSKTLSNGLREFEKISKNKKLMTREQKQAFEELMKDKKEIKAQNVVLNKKVKIQKFEGAIISGHEAFILFTTYGLPIEIVKDLADEKNIQVDVIGFEEELKQHQELSRTASAGKFKGGLADHSVETTRLHTANHLTLESLRQVLGDHIQQRGSNITKDRLRFDFSHDKKMTPEEIKQVEDLVNEQIKKGLPVSFEEMSVEDAKTQNAIGVFEHKYADKVKVYTMGDFSKEICGGPHVDNTSELGHFKITKESASSAGVRRLKAVLE